MQSRDGLRHVHQEWILLAGQYLLSSRKGRAAAYTAHEFVHMSLEHVGGVRPDRQDSSGHEAEHSPLGLAIKQNYGIPIIGHAGHPWFDVVTDLDFANGKTRFH